MTTINQKFQCVWIWFDLNCAPESFCCTQFLFLSSNMKLVNGFYVIRTHTHTHSPPERRWIEMCHSKWVREVLESESVHKCGAKYGSETNEKRTRRILRVRSSSSTSSILSVYYTVYIIRWNSGRQRRRERPLSLQMYVIRSTKMVFRSLLHLWRFKIVYFFYYFGFNWIVFWSCRWDTQRETKKEHTHTHKEQKLTNQREAICKSIKWNSVWKIELELWVFCNVTFTKCSFAFFLKKKIKIQSKPCSAIWMWLVRFTSVGWHEIQNMAVQLMNSLLFFHSHWTIQFIVFDWSAIVAMLFFSCALNIFHHKL